MIRESHTAINTNTFFYFRVLLLSPPVAAKVAGVRSTAPPLHGSTAPRTAARGGRGAGAFPFGIDILVLEHVLETNI